ncbi:hypothetical protein E2C01_003834 [Portunus trituberculatus]|uniref:Uncharacterized protein n=1 Tax=Portunus trituberculatus TaxID=210409 RepID=A0A5B7CS86_PORTR|nr:hypothetical protein [Portunus trituberculatus]
MTPQNVHELNEKTSNSAASHSEPGKADLLAEGHHTSEGHEGPAYGVPQVAVLVVLLAEALLAVEHPGKG